MSDTPILERLRAHATLGSAPEHELAWIVAHGSTRHLERGDILTARAAGSVDALYIILTGHVAIHIERGRGRRKVMEWRGGDVTGVLPYSRVKGSPGDVRAEQPTDIWAVPRERIPELITACPETTAILVHVMTDRARRFTSADHEHEKMLALGKLAAGMAHELNNPASAMVRSAKGLTERLAEVEHVARALGARGLTEAQIVTLSRVRDACLALPSRAWSPVERVDREDAIGNWIEGQGGDVTLAESLADTAVAIEQLDELAGALDADALNAALRWVAVGCQTRSLVLEIERGASRVFEMVGAIKGFTQMDRAMVAEPVDVADGLRNALTLVRGKARGKSIDVTLTVDPDVPAVHGVASELNQIWANLLDNALDAVRENGRVEVAARRDGGRVTVEIVDDGPGIPADIRDRIFDPFFTTKDVGGGAGLGLDVVRRCLEQHDGEIDVESRPGRTMFRIRLPAEGVRSSGRWSRSTERILIQE